MRILKKRRRLITIRIFCLSININFTKASFAIAIHPYRASSSYRASKISKKVFLSNYQVKSARNRQNFNPSLL